MIQFATSGGAVRDGRAESFMKYDYDGPRASATVERRFKASPEQVFDAFVNPEIASKWFFFANKSKMTYEMDPQVNGGYKVSRWRNGKTTIAEGYYREINRPQRLVFTFSMKQYTSDVDVVSVEFSPVEDGCLVKLTQSGLRPGYEKGTIEGWNDMFKFLERALA